MKNKALLFIFSAIIIASFSTLQSCQKSAFPSDPYRGASANPRSHPQKHDKPKATKAYRSLSVPPKKL